MFRLPVLDHRLMFPPASAASPEGIVALGGDLSTERLQLAYANGIFPWFDNDSLIIWWSPPQRMVLFPSEFHISKSLRQILRRKEFHVTFNKHFSDVISNCRKIVRKDQEGTWITPGIREAYESLHQKGLAISVEVWKEDVLVGGLYGVDLQGVFCGESMFSKASNASKVAMYHLVEFLKEKDYALIDCQVYTEHLSSLGAREISRADFLDLLAKHSKLTKRLKGGPQTD